MVSQKRKKDFFWKPLERKQEEIKYLKKMQEKMKNAKKKSKGEVKIKIAITSENQKIWIILRN
jgi:hypothetical protein